MPTAQDYFDGMDKEAIVLNQMAQIGTSAIARSGSKLGRIPNNFGVPVPKLTQAAGVKMKPFTPVPKSDVGKPKNWANDPVPRFTQAGSVSKPLQAAKTIRIGSGQIRI